MNRIDFQNGSQIQTTETNHDESQDETINIWYATTNQLESVAKIIRIFGW